MVEKLYYYDNIHYDLILITKGEKIMTHEQIWCAIDEFAHERGLSCAGLAKRSGLDPTMFNKSKRFYADGKPRWMTLESIAKVLNFANVSASDFFHKVDSCKCHRSAKNI